MLFLYSIHVLALAHLLRHVSATPLPNIDNDQSLFPRDNRMCANAPNIAAGTNSQLSLSTRDLHLAPRTPGAPTLWWCAPHSQTFLLITITHSVLGNNLHNILSSAFNYIISHVLDHGDGLLTGGSFVWTESNAVASAPSGGTDSVASSSASTGAVGSSNEMAVHVWNANNHQISYGVLVAALTSLIEYMDLHGWGTATFEIWDGMNIVGGGKLG